MTKFFILFFDNWLRPLIFLLIAVALFVIGELLHNTSIQNVFLLILGVSLLTLFVSAGYQFLKRRWTKGILTMLISLAVVVSFFIYTAWLYKDVPLLTNDDLEKLKPTFTEIHLPLNNLDTNAKTTSDFELYDSSGLGLYKYELWINRMPKGEVYLKTLETSTNTPIKLDKIRNESTIQIYNPTDSVTLSHMTKESTPFYFDNYNQSETQTIRVELWFKNYASGQEKKLLEKLYKIKTLTK